MPAAVSGDVSPPGMREVELSIRGMTCAACAARVQKKLSGLDDEPFPSSLCGVNLQGVDGLGELSGAPGAAAELTQDSPGLELGVRALTG